MGRLLLWLSWAFAAAYLAALILFSIGLFGLFGAEQDPLAGVFLIPLGLPWNFLADALPAPVQPAAAVLAPLINLFILRFAARVMRA
jgi:hypothetical protein